MIVNFINFNVTTGNMWLLFHNIITDTTFINTTFTLNPITLNNTVFYGRAVKIQGICFMYHITYVDELILDDRNCTGFMTTPITKTYTINNTNFTT